MDPDIRIRRIENELFLLLPQRDCVVLHKIWGVGREHEFWELLGAGVVK